MAVCEHYKLGKSGLVDSNCDAFTWFCWLKFGIAVKASISHCIFIYESHLNTNILHFWAKQIIVWLKNEQFAKSKLWMKATPTKYTNPDEKTWEICLFQ